MVDQLSYDHESKTTDVYISVNGKEKKILIDEPILQTKCNTFTLSWLSCKSRPPSQIFFIKLPKICLTSVYYCLCNTYTDVATHNFDGPINTKLDNDS